MGLYSFSRSHPTQADALVAKNYCNQEELEALNGIVSAYLEFAEMQARRHIPMYMKDWIETLDGFLRLPSMIFLQEQGESALRWRRKKQRKNIINSKPYGMENFPEEIEIL